MKVLIVKTSSLGDVIHTLPAITDASNAIADIQIDWVVEESFAEIPAWHRKVSRVIPVALRRWRKNIFSKETKSEWRIFRENLSQTQYDVVIDAQGLLKSTFLSCFAKGARAGFDWRSAREPLASLFYQQKFFVEKDLHAITRLRILLSKVLGYPVPDSIPDYGLQNHVATKQNYLVFLHGTTWQTKLYPEKNWIALATLIAKNNLRIKLPWGNKTEQDRAMRIAAACDNCEVLPKTNLSQMKEILLGAQGVIAVDTGLGHLAAALAVPTVSLYGPTNPDLVGTCGKFQSHLSESSMEKIDPERVYTIMKNYLAPITL